MKQKVAIIATLLTLFLCIGFLGAAAGIAAPRSTRAHLKRSTQYAACPPSNWTARHLTMRKG